MNQVKSACALVILIAIAASLHAKDKGDRDYSEAKAAESRQDWDSALKSYMSALDKNPNNPAYSIGMRRMRFQSAAMHVSQGQEIRAKGAVVEALGEFQKALIADPASAIAIQEMKRTQEILDQGEAGMTSAERARRAADEKTASIEAPPDLKPIVGVIQTLKINNQPPKVLYETIGKMAGVNVVFDSQYTAPQRNSNVDIANLPIAQAFDYLAILTRTYWKPITSNTIFVTEDNPTKRRDYEDEVMKVFYLANTTSVQELQEIANAIRTLGDIRRVFPINTQKALIVRATLDQMALAEKMLSDLDKPKPEVVIDVIVMQVNSTYSRSLAATLSSAGTTGVQQSIGFLPSTASDGTTKNGTIPLSRIGHVSIHDFSTSLPSAIVNAVMSDARTKTMNKPQVRASDGMKVELIIGQRIPYATGSFSNGLSPSSNVSPLVSTQFNYSDVGLKLSITPQVHPAREVTLHIEVEVSAVDQYVNISGISQPVIGQTKNIADIRLREGEVNILSGLSQNSDGTTVAGLPGLTNIPILGQFLFGSSTKNKSTSELMIALIPHIIRTPDYAAGNMKGIYVGTEQAVEVYFAPKTQAATPLR
jgi:general secretion pathway protein D